MQALTLAQRLRARFQHPATPRPVRLAHDLVENGQGRYLPVLSSTLAQDILSGGYTAQTLARVYENRTTGSLFGRIAERVVQDLPVHQALRERLEAAAGEIFAAVSLAARAGEQDFRALFAPCGLGAEMLAVAQRLVRERPELSGRFRCWGVDPDRDGALLPELARRARETGLIANLIREDLRRHREVAAAAKCEGNFHLVSCIGLTQLFEAEEVGRQLRFCAGLLRPGGTLVIDRWQSADSPELASSLKVGMQPLSGGQLIEMLRAAGLEVEREHPTGEGGCVLLVARLIRH
jgi:hypothetical protein